MGGSRRFNEHRFPSASSYRCDACGGRFRGEPAGRGLLLFPRGDRLEREEPPLCERCARAVEAAALRSWAEREEGG